MSEFHHKQPDSIGRFVRFENVARFSRMYLAATNDFERRVLAEMLAEEKEKQINAGDII